MPDPNAPGFREEAERQAGLLRGAPEEQEVLDWLEATSADLDPYDWPADGGEADKGSSK